jgi:hypothetical protein
MIVGPRSEQAFALLQRAMRRRYAGRSSFQNAANLMPAGN